MLMNKSKIVSRFYTIYGDDNPIYVGYTNRSINKRFAEHKRDKDFNDYSKVEVKEVDKQEFDFTWDIVQVNKNAKQVSDRESELITEYSTSNSIYQKGLGDIKGGQTWASVKGFVHSNKDNPKYRDISSQELLAYLDNYRERKDKLHNFIKNYRDLRLDKLRGFIGSYKDYRIAKLSVFISVYHDPRLTKLSRFIDRYQDPNVSKLRNFISNYKESRISRLSGFISSYRDPSVYKLSHFISNYKDPEISKLSNFVNDYQNPKVPKLRSFISSYRDPKVSKLRNFVSRYKYNNLN